MRFKTFMESKTEAELTYASYKPLSKFPRWALIDEFGKNIPEHITVYHAGKEITGKPIYVTDDKTYAEEFMKSGEKIFEFKNVPISELHAYGPGRITAKNRHTGTEGREFIYKPKK